MARKRDGKRGAALGEGLRSGGQILIDQLVAQGVERVYCVPGESYLAALDAMSQRADRTHRLPPGGGRRDHGADRGAAHRTAWNLLRHARPRRDQRRARASHRRARLRADDPVHRPGRAGDDGTRRLPGDGLSRPVRLDHEARDADRERRANPGGRPARVPYRDAGQARAGRDRAARGHADGNGRGQGRPARRGGSDLAGPDANGRTAEDAVGGGAAGRHPRRERMDQARERRLRPLRRTVRSAGYRLVSPLERLRRRA